LIDTGGLAGANFAFCQSFITETSTGRHHPLPQLPTCHTIQSLELQLTKANEAGYEFLTLTKILTGRFKSEEQNDILKLLFGNNLVNFSKRNKAKSSF
jgi:hypothetical protein